MSTHNIRFYEEISKIIPLLSSNMHLISSSESVELSDQVLHCSFNVHILERLNGIFV